MGLNSLLGWFFGLEIDNKIAIIAIIVPAVIAILIWRFPKKNSDKVTRSEITKMRRSMKRLFKEGKYQQALPFAKKIDESSKPTAVKITDKELEPLLKPLRLRNFAITRDNGGDVLNIQSGQSDVYGGCLNLVVFNQTQKVEKFITLERMVKDICKQGRF